MKSFLNIAEICPKCETLGPRERFVFWVQGCPFKCKGCISPEWIPFKVGHSVLVEDMAERIIQTKDISGITISGGEPFMQAQQLYLLLEILEKKRPELDVIVFSGFEKEQLVWKEAKKLLTKIDLLVAGVYIDSQNDGIGLRGSSNQNIYFFTQRLLPWKDEILGQRKGLELHVRRDGVLMAGIPQKNFKW